MTPPPHPVPPSISKLDSLIIVKYFIPMVHHEEKLSNTRFEPQVVEVLD